MTVTRRRDLTADFLRSAFDYDAASGALIWKAADCLPPNARSRMAGKVAGTVSSTGYCQIKIGGALYKTHRLVWLHVTGLWPDTEIDHIDGDKTNNRFENLRLASRSENMRNVGRYANNTSGAKGVHFEAATAKWVARIVLDGRTHHLGRHGTRDEARRAYTAAAERFHGTFARAA